MKTKNRTHQLLVYAGVKLLGENINITKKNTEDLLDASTEIVLHKVKYNQIGLYVHVSISDCRTKS
jgi:hypothetical protein